MSKFVLMRSDINHPRPLGFDAFFTFPSVLRCGGRHLLIENEFFRINGS